MTSTMDPTRDTARNVQRIRTIPPKWNGSMENEPACPKRNQTIGSKLRAKTIGISIPRITVIRVRPAMTCEFSIFQFCPRRFVLTYDEKIQWWEQTKYYFCLKSGGKCIGPGASPRKTDFFPARKEPQASYQIQTRPNFQITLKSGVPFENNASGKFYPPMSMIYQSQSSYHSRIF